MYSGDARIAALGRLFATAGYEAATPPVLQPVDIFLDLAGEDLRRRLFLTTGEDGQELCLRPDFTIPIARHYLHQGDAGRHASYSYAGPVFRHRAGQPSETLQAGVESIGRTDEEQADADMLRLALDASAQLNPKQPRIRIGDEGLFTAVLEALDIPVVWRRRLRDVFGERNRLDATIARMSADDAKPDSKLGFLAALEGQDPKAAVAVVEDLLSIAGIEAVGGRSAHEIAERFLEQAALSNGSGVSKDVTDRLTSYLNISGPPPLRAVETLDHFARETGLNIDASIQKLAKRTDMMSKHGIDIDALEYSGDFGRRLDYYTGFVFEMHDQPTAHLGQYIGGGRYDKLINLLGAEQAVPAVGFTIWLNRIGAEAIA
ncbi:ATP phosphoribosyltransferase regulatory subunit [Rhodobacteraceae bacterium RKSG542]|uniref:ATP phosphoribosyltransferase regulatory subunit n=1 Tax=Pseudovibrio flavus TaxID=2529854 RepID=UPI0012BC3627|nr:ATP phosphoribosyltransferase regulatory subunit [Pseudovibrio flavus]MTI18585.1 ATP phosphoribosyltransferase regulatory subunit [Pseudovibrio flavus]